MGINLPANTYTPFGSPKQRVSFTAKEDIAKAVARFAVLGLDPATAEQVPEEIRIAASTVDFEEIRDLVAQIKGVKKGPMVSKDLVAEKAALKANPGVNPLAYLQCVFSPFRRGNR